MKPALAHPIALATLGLASLSALAQTCATVVVDNVRPQQGQLMLAAYCSAEAFGKQPLQTLRLPAGEARMSFQLCGPAWDSARVALDGKAIGVRLSQ